jgi:hypothetical protein
MGRLNLEDSPQQSAFLIRGEILQMDECSCVLLFVLFLLLRLACFRGVFRVEGV